MGATTRGSARRRCQSATTHGVSPAAWALVLICGVSLSSCSSPSIQVLTNQRSQLTVGEDLLLTCIVNDVGSNTVMWTKIITGSERKKILSIDKLRVVQDLRVSVLHDSAPSLNSSLITPGGDVWVLSIKNVTSKDAGGYICRVNSDPPAHSYYIVDVKTLNESRASKALKSSHNYTDCCVTSGVTGGCLSFCYIGNILDGTTAVTPEKCEDQFPSIVRCMADFRDHTDCCTKQGVPDICQDICRGEYSVQSDLVKSHFSCNAFTEISLLCIAEGIEILPMPPRSPSVEVMGSSSFKVSWLAPKENSPPVKYFLINITTLASFDLAGDPIAGRDTTAVSVQGDVTPKKMQIKVARSESSYTVRDLSPVTWYEIAVSAVNEFGGSLSPYKMRVLTYPADSPTATPAVDLELPDIEGCCISKGVKHERCLQNLCNPSKRYIEEPDMIVCAAWAQETYSCLTGNFDHSNCCRKRGLPQLCVELCSGNVTKIDYTYFKCIEYFSDFRSCLLDGYGVLPSHPRRVGVSHLNPTYALLSWDPPEKNTLSVRAYHAYYRPLSHERKCLEKTFPTATGLSFLGMKVKSSPRVLENLCEGTEYEVYVEAFNSHGASEPSQRVIFKTPSTGASTMTTKVYNVTQCCSSINLSPGCLPLCGYDVRMSHYKALSATCTPEMSKILRCMVGGRDHSVCCSRRGVPSNCLSLCSGSFQIQSKATANCLPYLGNIVMCLEEGVDVLPGPVRSFHATEVDGGKVTLQWDPPESTNGTLTYQVHYQIVDKFSASHAVFKLKNTMNTTKPFAVLENLDKNKLYNLFVISVNEYGTSLPSSVLTINTTEAKERTAPIAGVPSAPHSMLLEDKNAVSLTIMWQPPLISLPTDRIRYSLHFAELPPEGDDPNYNKTMTSSTAVKLQHLSPNTQYIIFVTAVNDHGESRPSETLLAWTDPAYPAYVETPTVHPTNLIIEGGTMTILCIAMGSPTPKLSLFISGILIRQDVSRHMVTIVKNVSRSMTEVSCYADNGYGTPMQSSVSIIVSHRPTIEANEEVKVVAGSEVTVNCLVRAWPEPAMIWWEDVAQRVPVIAGANATIIIRNVTKGTYMMSLTLQNATTEDYYCHATNPLGTFTHTVKVKTFEEVRQTVDVTQCCLTHNVSDACLSACDFGQVDFHKQMNNDLCIPEFGKLLFCGADMSDHRGCCAKKGVPHQCLDWCRSKITSEHRVFQQCLLEWTPAMFECFQEGKESLPGPPGEVEFVSLTDESALISWKAPMKNPKAVELYRVFWREKGTKLALKNDTADTSLDIHNLKEGATYEVAVKAGNARGTSLLTQTRIFLHKSPYIHIQSTSTSNGAVTAVSIILMLVFVVLLAGFGWWLVAKKKILDKSRSGISFENPSYIREQNGGAVEITESPNEGNVISTNMSIPLTNGVSSQPATIPVTPEQSLGPGFEEDLDNKGGYKRFKS